MMTNILPGRLNENSDQPDEIQISVDLNDMGVRPTEGTRTREKSCTVYLLTGPEPEPDAGDSECAWWIL